MSNTGGAAAEELLDADLNELDLGRAKVPSFKAPPRSTAPNAAVTASPPPIALQDVPKLPAPEAEEPIAPSARLFQGHYHRLALLGAAEAAVVILAFYAAVAIRFGQWTLAGMQASIGPLWQRALAAVAVMALCLAAMGLYNLRQRVSFSGVAARVFAAVALAETFLAVLFYALPGLFVGRGVM